MKPEKQLIRNAFARAAPRYDEVAAYQRDAGEQLLILCMARLPHAPARVLDAGCGTGHGVQLFGQRWPAAHIVALDFAEPMLLRRPRASAAPATSVLCGDIEMLPLANEAVDLVWSSLAMQWCDAARVMREFARVLNPGGQVAATTLGPGTFAELRRAFAGVDDFRHTNDFTPEHVLQAAIADAGLQLLELTSVDMVRYYPDLRSLLASVRELGAHHVAAANRRPGLMGKTAWRRFVDNYEAMRTEHGLPLTYDTCFIGAAKPL